MRTLTDYIEEVIIPAIYDEPGKAFGGAWHRSSTAQRCREHIITDGHPSHDGTGGAYIRGNKPHIIVDGSDGAIYSEVVKFFQEQHNLANRYEAAKALADIYGVTYDVVDDQYAPEEYERIREERGKDIADAQTMARLTPDDCIEAEYLRARGINDNMRRDNDIFVVNERTAGILLGIAGRHRLSGNPVPTGVAAHGTHTIGIPIYEHGTIVAFYFRTIEPNVTPKYKAWKLVKDVPVMFALRHTAPQSRRTLVIVEGVFDVIAAQEVIGREYDVAGYLSASPTRQQAHAIAAAGYRNVIQIVDYDGTAKASNTVRYVQATAKTLEAEGLTALVVDLINEANPEEKQDANSYIQAFGADAFTDRVKRAQHVTGYIVNGIARAAANGTDEQRSTARHRIVEALAAEPSADVVKDIIDRENTPTATLFAEDSLRNQLVEARREAAANAARKEVEAMYLAAAEFTKAHEDKKAAECIAKAQSILEEGEGRHSWSTLIKGISREFVYEQLAKKADGLVTNWGVSYDGTATGRSFIVIPPAAITTVTARTGHGKTKLLINLALSYLEANEETGRHVVIVPYEEDTSDTVVNLINMKAAVHLRETIQGQTEYDNKAIIAYKLRRREPTGVDVVEAARDYIFDALESGRLIILEDEPTVEDIRRVTLDGAGDIAALFVDYLQQVQTTDRRATDPKNALVIIMRTLNSIARGTGTSVIAASQFNRECFSPVEMSEDKNAAASNIEWGSSQNIGLFSSYRHPVSAAWNANGPEVQNIKAAGFDPENPAIRTMFMKMLKGRQRGQADQWGVMTFDGNTGRIGGNFK